MTLHDGSGRVTVFGGCEGPSVQTLRMHEEGSIDLLFIDGDHSYAGEI